MILQALTSYYYRLVNDPESEIPEIGFSNEEIHFELVLARQGELISINNIQKPPKRGKKLIPKVLSVPKDRGRQSGIHPYFLWDKTAYVLGADSKSKPKRLGEQFEAFRKHQKRVAANSDDAGIKAVLSFLDAWDPEMATQLDNWEEIDGSNLVFRIDGETQYVHEHSKAKQAWLDYFQAETGAGEVGLCLATGENAPISNLHPSIKGKWIQGAQPLAYLVSFNMDAFSSYGKDQGYNAPVCKQAAFAYATTLNHLLRQDSPQKVQVGDATTVFWSEHPTKMENFFAAIMGGQGEQKKSNEAHDPGVIKDIRLLMTALKNGQEPPKWDDPKTPFYILGLSGNASRLAIRFWQVSNVGNMAQRLAEHFSDLEIEHRYKNEPEYPGIWRLLLETAPLRKTDNISPVLSGELIRSILTGSDYPQSLMATILARIRAEKEVTTFKAALLKAIFVRYSRNHNKTEEVSMSLDTQSTDIGYRLGRLFAVLEKAQQDAFGQNLNATIKDRFFGAASATPRSVFPRLLSLIQHHLAKLRKENESYAKAADKRLQEVLEGISDIPAHLNMQEQGKFALGYYHQKNAFFKKSNEKAQEINQQA
jgi:CRISPR-associated protein Csd1